MGAQFVFCAVRMQPSNITYTEALSTLIRRTKGGAWEPKKMILFLPPHNKVSLIFPMTFRFHLVFHYTFYPSLFILVFKELNSLYLDNGHTLRPYALSSSPQPILVLYFLPVSPSL
jgi:hypothetical protein